MRNKINKRFKSACRAVFKDKSKHCKWHDLRHSYAIFLLTKGVPIQLVAQSMGNSVSVCEKHYAGFVLTDVGISAINNILTPKENKTNNEPTKKQSHLKLPFLEKNKKKSLALGRLHFFKHSFKITAVYFMSYIASGVRYNIGITNLVIVFVWQ